MRESSAPVTNVVAPTFCYPFLFIERVRNTPTCKVGNSCVDGFCVKKAIKGRLRLAAWCSILNVPPPGYAELGILSKLLRPLKASQKTHVMWM